MSALYAACAVGASLLTIVFFYLASGHQKLVRTGFAGRGLRPAAFLALGVSYGLFACLFSLVTAFYVLTVWLMLFGSLVPMAIAFVRKGVRL